MNPKVSNEEAVLFVNWTDEDFTHTWNSVPYTFKAGMTIYMERWKAQHFARHLAIRECNKQNILTSNNNIESFTRKCFAESVVVSKDSEKAKTEIAAKNQELESAAADPVAIDAEPVESKPKKAPSAPRRTTTKPVAEETFEGLKK